MARRASLLDHATVPSLLLLAALGLVCFRLTSKSLGLDEATSVYYATLDFGALGRLLSQRDPNMSVYYFMLRGWTSLFGQGETSVRLLSAIPAALSVPAIYLVGARLYGRTGGLVSASLLLLNAAAVQYAQTVRAYSLVTLLVIISTLCFIREIDRPSRAARVGYVIASVLAFYAQYFAALVFIAQFASLLVARSRARLARERLTMGVAVFVLCLPELIIAARVGASVRLDWVQPLALDSVRRTIVALAGGSAFAFVALLLIGCVGLGKAIRAGDAWPHYLTLFWFAIPAVIALLVSFERPLFVVRFLLVSVPGLALFAGGIARLRSPALVAAAVAVIAWPTAVRLRDYYGEGADEEWREATSFVLAASKPGDGIRFFPAYNRRPFDYYHSLSSAAAPANVDRRTKDATPRVWFVIRGYEAESRAEDLARARVALTADRQLVSRRAFRHVIVELYARRRVAATSE